MFWFGKVSSVIVWFGIIWYGGATMLKNIDSNICQNAAVIIWQKAGAEYARQIAAMPMDTLENNRQVTSSPIAHQHPTMSQSSYKPALV